MGCFGISPCLVGQQQQQQTLRSVEIRRLFLMLFDVEHFLRPTSPSDLFWGGGAGKKEKQKQKLLRQPRGHFGQQNVDESCDKKGSGQILLN